MNTTKILLIFLAFFLSLCFILMNVYNSKNNSKDNINENFSRDNINIYKKDRRHTNWTATQLPNWTAAPPTLI